MRKYPLLAILLLLACRDRQAPASSKARDLAAELQVQPTRRDTAAERADSQFRTCLYVYDNEEKQRECLVLRSGWAPEEAERWLARRRAEIRRVADSIQRAQDRYDDSLARRRDSILAIRRRKEATLQAVRDSQALHDSLYAASFPVWGEKSTQRYFSGRPGCMLAARLPDWDRVLFKTTAEAERAGFTAYDSDIRCRVTTPP